MISSGRSHFTITHRSRFASSAANPCIQHSPLHNSPTQCNKYTLKCEIETTDLMCIQFIWIRIMFDCDFVSISPLSQNLPNSLPDSGMVHVFIVRFYFTWPNANEILWFWGRSYGMAFGKSRGKWLVNIVLFRICLLQLNSSHSRRQWKFLIVFALRWIIGWLDELTFFSHQQFWLVRIDYFMIES